MKDMISVIIPLYNRQDVIKECIDSVTAQSYQNFEIVLIDDGSTDDTFKICKILAENEPRIKLLETEHGGVSAARNKGIELAEGEYIFFLDSDDAIHPDVLRTLVDGIKSSDAAIAGTGIVNVHEIYWNKVIEKIAEDTIPGETEYKSHNAALDAIFQGKSPLNLIGGVMMRRDLIGETRFRTDLFIGEDFYFVYENLIKGSSAVFAKQKRYYCRIHANSSSNNFNFAAFRTRFYRRELVWKSEEALGRTKYANLQKIDAIGCYTRCIIRNRPGSEDAKKMQKTLKTYKKELLPALSFKRRIHFYLCLYAPFTLTKFKRIVKKLKK